MEKYIKGKWFLLVAVFIMIVVIAFVMAISGWRITYAPDLENNWNAISAVGVWAGSIGTVIAVFSAIQVAYRQNKIQLFEKRYKIYQLFDSCMIFSDLLEKLKSTKGLNVNDIQVLFLSVFCNIPMGTKINDFIFLRMQYIAITDQLKQSQFLFDEEIQRHLLNIACRLEDLINAICCSASEDQLKACTQAYILLMLSRKNAFILNKIRKKLMLPY